MRMGNITMLFAALICAVAAALLSRAWLKDRTGGERVIATQQESMPPTTRSIVVAARELKSGDKLNAESLRLMPWSGDTVPRGAFLTMEALLKPGQERTVQAAVAENEPVLEQKLSSGGQGMLASRLADSMNAMTIRVNDVAGVAGFLQPDDRVDVFMTTGSKINDGPAPEEKPSVVVLMQNVRVLAVDQAAERKGTATAPKAVTLEVSTEDAQKLVLAGSIGQLSLALRRFNDGVEGKTRTIALEDLLAKQPLGPSGKAGQVIGVTRAAERHEYTVQSDPPKLRRSEATR